MWAFPAWARVLLVAAVAVSMYVPIIRLEYQARIHAEVTPLKQALLEGSGKEHTKCNAFLSGDTVEAAKGQAAGCQAFCESTLTVSQKRQEILHDARNRNVLARLLAEAFDGARGTDQAQKLAKLYERKTCAEVIARVDGTNKYANTFMLCWVVAGLQLILYLVSLSMPNGGGERR